MSQIAHALAKAKERTGHTTAPFLASGGVITFTADTEREAALRRAARRQRFWIILVAVAMPLTAFVVWTQFKTVLAPSPAEEHASGTSVSSPGLAAEHTLSRGGETVSQTTGTASGNRSSQRPDLVQAVSALAISAVMPGEPARIMLAGRVVRAGQGIENGLVFAGIADGELRFTDGNGVVYTRRY